MNKFIKSDLGNKEVFSRNLNRYLRLSGKTKKEVAAAVKISESTFCEWTKGRVYPRMDKVQALAEYFGIRMSDLVENSNIDKETITNQEQEIFDLFHRVPEEKRELVLSMIRAAIDNL